MSKMTEMERVARRDILMQHARALHDYCKVQGTCDDCPFFYIDEEGFDACHLNAGVPPEEWEPDEWGDDEWDS